MGGGAYDFVAGGEPFADNSEESEGNDSSSNVPLKIALGVISGVAVAAIGAAVAVVLINRRNNNKNKK